MIGKGNLAQRFTWAAQGVAKLITGEAAAAYYAGDWYWNPSRAIQPEAGNEITEFPFFTFLYSDLHAHMMALPADAAGAGLGAGMLLGRRPLVA